MYTEFNSKNIHKDPEIYVTEKEPTFSNRVFSLVWKILLVIIVFIVLFLALIHFGVISLKSDVTPEAVLLNQNEIGIKRGSGYQFVYTVLPENSTNKQVVWESSDPSVVKVNEVSGYAEALRNGTAVITVKTIINEKLSECAVTVSDKNVLLSGINVNEKYINVAVGYKTTLSYRTTPSNATELNLIFSSSDSSVAEVNSKGVITGHKEGSAIITVSSSNGAISDTAYVTVYKKGEATVVEGESVETTTYPKTLKLNDKNITLKLGSTNQLIATVTPTSAPQTVTWSSSNTKVATVNSRGLITATGVGTTTIVAKSVNNITDTCTVTVGNYSLNLKEIDITTNYSVLPLGVNKQLVVAFKPSNASNKTITWSSSNPNVATVDKSGYVKTLSVGSTVITAKAADGGYTDTATIEVVNHGKEVEETNISFSNSTYSVGIGNTITLSPIIKPENATFKSVDFESSDTSIATVDANGIVKGIKEGTVTITATTKRNRLQASVKVNVKLIKPTGVSLNSTSVTLSEIGCTFTLVPTIIPNNASNKAVTFKSSDPSIATVDSNGIVTAVGKGKTTITVTPKGGGSASTCIVNVLNTDSSSFSGSASSVVVYKPILYLYPIQKTNVKVNFEHPEYLMTTYPKYINNWSVTAYPNGDLYDKDNKYYYGLFWDEEKHHEVDFKEGFYVTKENAISFLEEKLDIIGLNARERNEFIMFWLPILERNEKSLVYFELTKERESYNKLLISPKPDTLLRVLIHIKKVENEVPIKEQKLESFKRNGFAAVEWGGLTY